MNNKIAKMVEISKQYWREKLLVLYKSNTIAAKEYFRRLEMILVIWTEAESELSTSTDVYDDIKRLSMRSEGIVNKGYIL